MAHYQNQHPVWWWGWQHLQSVTRAQLLWLRTAGTLVPWVSYQITDHVQWRLVTWTTVTLLATSITELSHDARVNTTYDNTSRFGLYDIDTALVYELTDNRANTCKWISGNEVANFDRWNTIYSWNYIDSATFTVTYWAAWVRNNNYIVASTVNLTNFTGQFYQNRVHTAANWNLQNANWIWRYNEVKNGWSLNMLNFSWWWDHYYNEFDSSTISLMNLSWSCTIRQNEILSSSWSITWASSVVITNCHLTQHAITRAINQWQLNMNLCTSETGGSTSVTWAWPLNITWTNNNWTIEQQSTWVMTVSNCYVWLSSLVRNWWSVQFSITRTSLSWAWTGIYTDAWSSTVTIVTDCKLSWWWVLRVVWAVWWGNLNVVTTDINSWSYVYKRHTWALTLSQSSIISWSWIDTQSWTRNYIINRSRLSEIARITLTWTWAFTDTFNDVIVINRATVNISCSWGNNTLNFIHTSWLSWSINLWWTTWSQILQRIHCFDSWFSLNGVTAAMTHDINQFYQVWNCTISNIAVAKPMSYCRIENWSINVTWTVAWAIVRANVRCAWSINVSWTCWTVDALDCSMWTLALNGWASHNNITKDMIWALTTNNFTSANVLYMSNVNKTYTANNPNRATYLWLVSSVPVL